MSYRDPVLDENERLWTKATDSFSKVGKPFSIGQCEVCGKTNRQYIIREPCPICKKKYLSCCKGNWGTCYKCWPTLSSREQSELKSLWLKKNGLRLTLIIFMPLLAILLFVVGLSTHNVALWLFGPMAAILLMIIPIVILDAKNNPQNPRKSSSIVPKSSRKSEVTGQTKGKKMSNVEKFMLFGVLGFLLIFIIVVSVIFTLMF